MNYSVDTTAIRADALPDVVVALSALQGPEFREKVLALEESMRDYPQIDAPLVHRFAPGLYARECALPAGSMVVGKIHRHAHLIQLLKGKATIATEHGTRTYEAPEMWTSIPGAKRVVYSHTDTVFVTFHPSDETDLTKLEDHIIAPTYAALEHVL